MGRTRKAEFCKSEGCPSSQELYAFQNGDMSNDEGRDIMLHLRVCEFCTAEAEFYEHYPQQAAITGPEKMPEPLYELASALLRNECDGLPAMDDLIVN